MLPIALLLTAAAQPIDQARWITPDDYPQAALRDAQEGATAYRLTIAPDGTAERCEVIHSSGFSALDAKTCPLVTRRARFTPARDEKGDVTYGVVWDWGVWTIPETGRAVSLPPRSEVQVIVRALPAGLAAPVNVTTQVVVSASGGIERCDAVPSPASAKLGKVACEQVAAQWTPAPALTHTGSTVRSVQSVTVAFTAGTG